MSMQGSLPNSRDETKELTDFSFHSFSYFPCVLRRKGETTPCGGVFLLHQVVYLGFHRAHV